MEEQLETAAKLASARPARVLKKRTAPIRARPSSIALKATPAPALGPEDELLFDPDEPEFGEAGPGGGYNIGEVNVPLGVQVGETMQPQQQTQETPAATEQQQQQQQEEGDPLVVDLDDDESEKKPEESKGFFSGAMFWVFVVGILITCGLCLMYFMNSRGQASSSTPPSSYGGMDSLGGLGLGGGGGLGGTGMGTGGGLGF